jgi:hypothetical protein
LSPSAHRRFTRAPSTRSAPTPPIASVPSPYPLHSSPGVALMKGRTSFPLSAQAAALHRPSPGAAVSALPARTCCPSSVAQPPREKPSSCSTRRKSSSDILVGCRGPQCLRQPDRLLVAMRVDWCG